jgi:LysR family hydrogen peroxide-inducible transcriptional activator
MSLGPPPFSLRQLQYAVAVAEALSFRKAAEHCHVSQPSLSAQLAALEQALGLRLFERDRRHVLITPIGRQLVARARQVLQETEDLVESARRAGDPLAGNLRVGVIPTISPYLLPCAAPALRLAYPRLAVFWIEDKTEVLVRALDQGGLEAALLALEAPIGDLEREVIALDPFVLATPRGHPLGERKAPVALKELRGQAFLLLNDGHCFREQALAFCSGAKARELEFRATSLSTLAQMVAGGAGVTLLPELAVPTETRGAQLRVRRFSKPAPHRTIALVWRRHSPLEPALRQLATTLRTAYPVTHEPPDRRTRPRPIQGQDLRTRRSAEACQERRLTSSRALGTGLCPSAN